MRLVDNKDISKISGKAIKVTIDSDNTIFLPNGTIHQTNLLDDLANIVKGSIEEALTFVQEENLEKVAVIGVAAKLSSKLDLKQRLIVDIVLSGESK